MEIQIGGRRIGDDTRLNLIGGPGIAVAGTEDNDRVNLTFSDISQAVSSEQIVLWGDSLTADGYVNAGSYEATGFWTWATVMLGHRFKLVNVAGHGGFTTTQLLATYQADVVAFAPAWVLVEIGINDVTNDVASATTIANLTTIYTNLLNAGIRVIATTLPPSVNVNTTARRTALYTINNFIRSYCQQHNGIVLVDWYDWLADPTSSVYIANYSVDGVHPSPLGAYYMGQAIAQVLEPLTFPNPPFPQSNIDPGNQIVTNPMMDGNSGGIATNWSWLWDGTAGAVAHSKVPRTDGIQGAWQQAVVSGAPTVSAHYSFGPCLPASGWAVGDTIYAVTEFQVDPGFTYFSANAGVPAQLRVFCHGPSNTFFDMRTQGSYVNAPAGVAMSGALRTPNFVIPATTDQLFLQLFTFGLGTIRYGRSQIFKTTPGAVWG